MNLYVNEYGAKVNMKNGVVCISKNGSILNEIPINLVDSLAVHSSVQITSQTITALSKNNCPVSWFDGINKLICSTDCDNIGHVLRRKHQYKLIDNARFRIGLSRKIIISKLISQYDTLKNIGASVEALSRFEQIISKACSQCRWQKDISSLRGIEGNCAAVYFSEVRLLVPKKFGFDSRTRQPPKDEYNAMLGFLYSLLYNEITMDIRSKGLDPYVGFMHEIKNGHYALASDVMEEFRYICDLAAFELTSSVDKEIDFSNSGDGVYFSGSGRAKAIAAYNKAMLSKCSYMNFIGYGNTVRDCLKRQLDKLAYAIDSEKLSCFEPIRSEKTHVLCHSI